MPHTPAIIPFDNDSMVSILCRFLGLLPLTSVRWWTTPAANSVKAVITLSAYVKGELVQFRRLTPDQLNKLLVEDYMPFAVAPTSMIEVFLIWRPVRGVDRVVATFEETARLRLTFSLRNGTLIRTAISTRTRPPRSFWNEKARELNVLGLAINRMRLSWALQLEDWTSETTTGGGGEQ